MLMTIVYAVVSVVVLAVLLWLVWRWGSARGWWKDSETIFVAWVLRWAGVVGIVLGQTDIGAVMTAIGLGRYSPVALLVIGIIVAGARKSRTEGGITGNDLTPIPPKAP